MTNPENAASLLPGPVSSPHPCAHGRRPCPDMADVRGLDAVKRALTIAALGGFHVMLVGPPGSGKSLLAKRVPGILPPMTDAESDEVTRIYALAGRIRAGERITSRPLRAPHHTASVAALVGGGRPIRPGEVTLAHRGVLFLDDLPEFPRLSQEHIAGALIDRESRLRGATFLATFTLIGAMWPCPCGFRGDPSRRCRCRAHQIRRYWSRIAQPLRDAIDLWVHVPALTMRAIREERKGGRSAQIRARLAHARQCQPTFSADIEKAITDQPATDRARLRAIEHTIAALDSEKTVTRAHLEEARTYLEPPLEA